MYLRPFTDHSATTTSTSGVGTVAATSTTATSTSANNRRPVMEVTTAKVTEIETTTTLSSIMQDPDPPAMVDDDIDNDIDNDIDDVEVVHHESTNTMVDETEDKLVSSIVSLEISVQTATHTATSTGDLSQKKSHTNDGLPLNDTSDPELASHLIDSTNRQFQQEHEEEKQMPDHVSAASEIEEGLETNAEQVTKESSNKAKDRLSQTTVESRIQETPVEVAMEEQEIKQEYTIGENMEVTSETENDNENNVSEPSNFETSHEVTEIDILEPANTIENLQW